MTWCSALVTICSLGAGDPSGEAILRNVEGLFDGVRDYSVVLEITADIERLNVPPMKARMYFKQPDKTHFEAQGFALLPKEGLGLNIGKLLARYNVGRVERELVEGMSMYKVTLIAKSERLRVRDVVLLVHPVRWTVEKLITPQPGERLMSASFRYTQVGGFWVPSEMIASFSLAPADTSDPDLPEQAPAPRPQQMPRNGKVIVRYSDYRLNTGLSDDIFDRNGAGPNE